MREQVQAWISRTPSFSPLFDLKGEAAEGRLLAFDLEAEEVRWWRLPVSTRMSRALRSGNVRSLNSSAVSDPLELFRLIGSCSIAARSLLYPLRAPAYWVRCGDAETDRRFRPAIPETQLSDLLEVPTRQISPALRPLLQDGAIELVRGPTGVRAVLVRDGFIEEVRFRALLKA